MATRRMDEATSRRWVLGLASLGAFMVALDGLVVTTALSRIRADLDASVTQLVWTINAFSLSFAGLLMTGAVLGDRFGRRRVFVAGLALFTAASAGCALAPDAGWLIAGRAVQGAGAALVSPVAMALVTAAFPPERRGHALGIFSAVIGLALLGGPVIGGAVTAGLRWEWIFWLNVPIGLAAIPLVLARIEESHGPRSAPDLPGVVLVIGLSFGLAWGLVRGNEVGWTSAEVLGALGAGVVLTVALIAWELRTPHPMLPLPLFRSRAFSVGNGISFLLFASNLSIVFFLAQFLQTSRGASPLVAGLEMLPWTVPLFIGAPRAGALVDRVGERPLIFSGMLLQVVGLVSFAVIAQADAAYWTMVLPMVIAGIGNALAMPAAQKAVVGAVPRVEAGRASGTFTTMRWLGGAFGVAVAVAAFGRAGAYGSPESFADGFVAAAAVSATLALLGALAAALLPAVRRVAAPVAAPAAALSAPTGDGGD